jgi:hypothetical protein
MKKLPLLFLILLIGLGYYVAWPAWSAYELQNAIKAKDVVTIVRKIDFPSVRASLRPAAVQKLAELSAGPRTLPTSAVQAERIKQDAATRIVDRTLEGTATPDGLLRIISETGPLKASIEQLLRDHMSRVGERTTLVSGAGTAAAGKSGPVVRTVGTEEPRRQSRFGFSNIKSIWPASPFRYEIGIAKDQAATRPDILVDFGFTGTDWKITGIRQAT